jgi:hypothetical protein
MTLISSKGRKQLGHNGYESGTKHHNEDSGKNEKHHRNHHLDRQLGCLFFSPLSAAGSESI